MHQHGDSIHAAILHVPQFHQVPQKLHRRSCTLPGRKGSTKKSTRDTKSSSVEEKLINNFSQPRWRNNQGSWNTWSRFVPQILGGPRLKATFLSSFLSLVWWSITTHLPWMWGVGESSWFSFDVGSCRCHISASTETAHSWIPNLNSTWQRWHRSSCLKDLKQISVGNKGS